MAWTRDKDALSVVRSGAPSLVHNNLSCGEAGLAYIHQGTVITMDSKGANQRVLGKGGLSGRVHQAAFVVTDGIELLVVALTTGVQIWSSDGARLLYYFELSSVIARRDSELQCCRGIAAVKGGTHVLVGCSDGDVFVFAVNVMAGDKVELRRTLMGHSRAIACAAASTDHCATADIGGRIIVWTASDKFNKVCEYSSDGHCVTSLAMRDTLLVAALSTGTLKIYRAAASELLVEIGAHARAITAIDIHPTQGFVASVAEDAFLNVWSLPDSSDHLHGPGQADLLYSDEAVDCMLTGVAFRKDRGPGDLGLVATAYDTDVVHSWSSWGR